MATIRIIFHCNYKPCGHSRQFKCACSNRACGHVWAYDYEEVNGKLVRFYKDSLSGITLGSTPEEDGDRCPKCYKRVVKASKVTGKAGHKHCNGECETATNDKCVCSCGGANHGKAH